MLTIPYLNNPAWTNGVFCSVSDLNVSILDLGLIHSDATYDVIAFKNNSGIKLNEHLDRFITSCNACRIDLPYSKQELSDILTELHKRTGWNHSLLWISATRGIPFSGNPRDLQSCVPRLMAYAKPYQKFNGTGKATVYSAKKVVRVPDCSINQNHKNFVWNDLTSAQWEAIDHGYDTAVLFGTSGLLTEGPGFNVAIVSNNCVMAPRTNRLPGISMRLIEELCLENNINFKWTDITENMVNRCDDMFLTTTVGNLVTVTKYNGREFQQSEIQKKLAELLELYGS